MAGGATPTSSAGHASAGANTTSKLTFKSDHQSGAGQQDVPFDEQNRNLFAFAAYDMGPGAIQSLRRKAEAAKLDPNVWFNNVERVAAARIGQEPVRYYVAYKLIEEADAAKKAAIAAATAVPATAGTSAPPQPSNPH